VPQPTLLPEFPPGLFTDSGNYRLNDLRGKTIVLFFFDPTDERALATLAHRNALVRRFADRPVAFFGVVNATIDEARRTVQETGLAMPVFADTLSVLAIRYHVALSARQTWQSVIIDADGRLAPEELTEHAILNTLPAAHWTYRDRAPDPTLDAAVDAFESADYARGMRLLAPLLAGTDHKSADAARKLQAILRADAERWKAQAEQLEPTAPVDAYDLYNRVGQIFTGPDAVHSVTDALKRLESNRDVRAELNARAMVDLLSNAVARDEQIQRLDATAYCDQIIRACPGTPTAERLVRYLDDLGKARDHALATRAHKIRRGGSRAPSPLSSAS
jgi:peroxiredoxin